MNALAGGILQPATGGAVEGAHEAVEAEAEHLYTWRSQEPIKEESLWSSGGPGAKAPLV